LIYVWELALQGLANKRKAGTSETNGQKNGLSLAARHGEKIIFSSRDRERSQ
jgi:hypothetical protein